MKINFKKSICIISMLLAFIVCAPSIKADNSSSGLTFDVFTGTMKELHEEASWYGIPESKVNVFRSFIPSELIERQLLKLGFICESQKQVTYEGNPEDGPSVLTESKYVKGNTTVFISGARFEIKFPTAAEKDAFISTVKAKGYIFNKAGDGSIYYSAPGNDEYHWAGVFVFVNGNKVVLSQGFSL